MKEVEIFFTEVIAHMVKVVVTDDSYDELISMNPEELDGNVFHFLSGLQSMPTQGQGVHVMFKDTIVNSVKGVYEYS